MSHKYNINHYLSIYLPIYLSIYLSISFCSCSSVLQISSTSQGNIKYINCSKCWAKLMTFGPFYPRENCTKQPAQWRVPGWRNLKATGPQSQLHLKKKHVWFFHEKLCFLSIKHGDLIMKHGDFKIKNGDWNIHGHFCQDRIGIPCGICSEFAIENHLVYPFLRRSMIKLNRPYRRVIGYINPIFSSSELVIWWVE